MQEQNLRKCKKCNELKNRIYDGKFPNGKDKRWIDDDKLIWNGNVCGKCNQSRAKVTMQKARAHEK